MHTGDLRDVDEVRPVSTYAGKFLLRSRRRCVRWAWVCVVGANGRVGFKIIT